MDIHKFIKETFNNESIFFEIGSHFGVDTLILLQTTDKVHCFEPDERNIKIFKEKNVPAILNEFAVSDEDGQSDFFLSSGNVYDSDHGPTVDDFVNKYDWSASSSLKKPKNHLLVTPWVKFENTVKVKTQRIDSYCTENEISHIDLVWMDVQGAEMDVISGTGDFLKKIHYIFTEYSNDELYENQPTRDQILKVLGKEWEIDYDYGGDILLRNKIFKKL
jgi:FkbM family methyltransferase